MREYLLADDQPASSTPSAEIDEQTADGVVEQWSAPALLAEGAE